MKRLSILIAVMAVGLVVSGVAQAQTAALSGTAIVEGDHVRLVSDYSDDPANTANNAGAVTFTGTGVTTFNSLSTLSAEFNVTDDSCLGGSPRFELDFAGTTNNVFVYLGTYNSTTGQFDCTANTWISSGNLIGVPATDLRYDLTQFGGPFYGTYAQAQALVGTQTIEQIRFVVDGGWAFPDKEQTVLLRKVTINASTFTWTQARVNPAQACRELRDRVGATNFVQTWGTNTNKRNAFGKCVSHMAKMQSQAIKSAQASCKSRDPGADRKACVTAKAHERFNAKRARLAAAVTSCAADRNDHRAAFIAWWGPGKSTNVKAAFAACVRHRD